MRGVEYAVVVAAFALCVAVVLLVWRRPGRGEGVRPDADNAELIGAELIGTMRAQADALVRVAEVEAESARQLARAEADSVRRLAEAAASAIREAAQQDAAALRRDAQLEGERIAERLEALEQTLAGRGALLDEAELRVGEHAERIDAREAEVARSLEQLARRGQELEAAERRLDAHLHSAEAREAELQHALERLAGMSAETAKAELVASVEAAARREAAIVVRTIEDTARSEGDERARVIVAEAVQRVASQQTAETVVSVMHLPGDEMKGRIIGREGRNIRAFESVTGVNVIIDDTPEAVLLSCFDPVRREVGRLTLEKLILDGRIHPQRIEDLYEQSKAELDALCLRAAEDALTEVGIGDIDERLMPTIGRLRYRTSYGQNVLAHLVETAHIAGVMAAELGLEPTLIKRCAFLHDIGKALTHEVEGSHAIVGAELLRRFGEDEAVVHAVEAHHNEVAPRTIEAVLTQASDTCSASRPGARRESLESYVKRLARIEEIATAKEGVEKVFAMQAGREVRVMVTPGEVDDLAASVLAREIAKQIEDELTYPGQIRVTVVRESRSTEIAH